MLDLSKSHRQTLAAVQRKAARKGFFVKLDDELEKAYRPVKIGRPKTTSFFVQV
jgi:hypothetical protein